MKQLIEQMERMDPEEIKPVKELVDGGLFWIVLAAIKHAPPLPGENHLVLREPTGLTSYRQLDLIQMIADPVGIKGDYFEGVEKRFQILKYAYDKGHNDYQW